MISQVPVRIEEAAVEGHDQADAEDRSRDCERVVAMTSSNAVEPRAVADDDITDRDADDRSASGGERGQEKRVVSGR